MAGGWLHQTQKKSLPESFSTVSYNTGKAGWRKFFGFAGPGMMVAVGYMDPGNWATDIAGGSAFGTTLLSVVLISNIFAMVLQHLSLKLGIAGEKDLAQACHDSFPRGINFILWIFCEIAIAACDMAEVIGSAIALNLLFGLPLLWGIVFTILDVFLILLLQRKGFRWLERFVASLIFIILCCFIYELMISQPSWRETISHLVPRKEIITNPDMLYIAIGILGATVMPHNLYLHSSIVQTRNYPRNSEGKKEAIRLASWDSNLSLLLAFFINSSILIMAATAFHKNGYFEITELQDAYKLLTPLLGTGMAAIVFGIALLASGQTSTLTGTLAGQIVMEGFLNIQWKPWVRRIVTRLIAVGPALIAVVVSGEKGISDLLILSQVILSLQLAFAVIPLIMFTSNKEKMHGFQNSTFLTLISVLIAVIIVVLNLYLVFSWLQ